MRRGLLLRGGVEQEVPLDEYLGLAVDPDGRVVVLREVLPLVVFESSRIGASLETLRRDISLASRQIWHLTVDDE